MPRYEGEFCSISQVRDKINQDLILMLEDEGVVLDDFYSRRNAVILPNGEIKLFDLSIKPISPKSRPGSDP